MPDPAPARHVTSPALLPERYIVSGYSIPRRGTIRVKHIAAGPKGLAILCPARLTEPHVLTGRDFQHATCRHCQRIVDRQHARWMAECDSEADRAHQQSEQNAPRYFTIKVTEHY